MDGGNAWRVTALRVQQLVAPRENVQAGKSEILCTF